MKEPDELVGDVDGSNPLRLLVIDSKCDALTTVLALNQQGFEPIHYRCVDRIEGIRKALLDELYWSLVLSEYKLPGFELSTILPFYKPRFGETPFIIVSSFISEQQAAEMMEYGAHDCIRKYNLARLGMAVKRELKAAATRRELSALKARIKDLGHTGTVESARN